MSENTPNQTPEQKLVSCLEDLYAIDPLVVQIEEGKDPSVPKREQLEQHHAQAVKKTIDTLLERQKTFAGYQLSQAMKFDHFAPLLDTHLNNIGGKTITACICPVFTHPTLTHEILARILTPSRPVR